MLIALSNIVQSNKNIVTEKNEKNPIKRKTHLVTLSKRKKTK
jgi:hypothetical protein